MTRRPIHPLAVVAVFAATIMACTPSASPPDSAVSAPAVAAPPPINPSTPEAFGWPDDHGWYRAELTTEAVVGPETTVVVRVVAEVHWQGDRWAMSMTTHDLSSASEPVTERRAVVGAEARERIEAGRQQFERSRREGLVEKGIGASGERRFSAVHRVDDVVELIEVWEVGSGQAPWLEPLTSADG